MGGGGGKKIPSVGDVWIFSGKSTQLALKTEISVIFMYFASGFSRGTCS